MDRPPPGPAVRGGGAPGPGARRGGGPGGAERPVAGRAAGAERGRAAPPPAAPAAPPGYSLRSHADVVPGGDRIWYFPTASGHLAAVPPGEGRNVVGEAARLGDEHAVGRYAVHLFVLDKPTDRAALIAGQAHARAASVVPIEVVP